MQQGTNVDWSKISTETYKLAEECLKTNYYGAKGVIEALLPIPQLSNSPRIVNVSSSMGHLKVWNLLQVNVMESQSKVYGSTYNWLENRSMYHDLFQCHLKVHQVEYQLSVQLSKIFYL